MALGQGEPTFPADPPGVKRVLVVDDEKLVRWTLKSSLERAGYEAITVEDADSAMNELSGGQFSIVITDVRLIGMSGTELLSRIKEMDPELPVILITAYGSDTMREEARSKGASAFFDKPFDIKALIEKVDHLCKRK